MESPAPQTFADVFNALLRARGLSQRQAAIMLDVAESQVSRWRRGQGGISLENIERIATTFGIDRDHLARLAGLRDSAGAFTPAAIEIERAMWQGVYDELIEKEVPRSMWESYIEACRALGRVFKQITPAPLRTPPPAALSDHPAESESPSSDGGGGGLAAAQRLSRLTLQTTSP